MISIMLKEIGSVKMKDDKEFTKSLKEYLKGDKLDTCIQDFWINRENNKSAVQLKYKDLVKQLAFFYSLLHNINAFIKQSYTDKKDKEVIKYRINVCSRLYNKSLQTFADMFGLIENGSVMNTFLLWRSIYENYIISSYIANGTEEEAKLFLEYETVQKNKLLGIKLSKEEKAKFVKKFGKDFESNDFCWAKNVRGKKSFLKIVRLVKDRKYYKYYLLSNYIGLSNAFSVDNGIVYNEKAQQSSGANNKMIGFAPDFATKSLNVFIVMLTELAYIMIDHYIDDKKQKDVLIKMVSCYSREIDRKWKKY